MAPLEVGSVAVRLGGIFDRKGFDQFEREHVKAQRAKDIDTRLGGDFDRKSFDVYERELDKVQARVKRREAFKATLGGDYNAQAFRAYERDLNKAERDTVQAQGRMRTAFGSVWGRGGAAFAAAGGAYGLATAVRSVVSAYGEAETSAARVKRAVENQGIAYDKHADQIDKVIQKQSQLAGLDDEDLADSFAKLLPLTNNITKALELNGLAADVARGRQINLEAANRLVARAYMGNAGALKRLGIQLDPVTKAQDKLKESHDKATDAAKRQAKEQDQIATGQAAIAKLQRQFAGQAEDYGKTQKGAIDRVNVAWENLQETLGEKLSPWLTRTLNKLADFVNEMDSGTGAGGRFVDKLEDARDTLKDIAGTVKDNIDLIKLAAEAWVGYRIAAGLAKKAAQFAPAPAVPVGAPGAPAPGKPGKGPTPVGGWGSSVKGLVGGTIVTTAGLEIGRQLARGPAGPDSGLLNQYADALERVVKAGDAPGMRRLSKELRDVAAAHKDVTKGENLLRFADALDHAADSGGKDLRQLGRAFQQLPKTAGPSITDVLKSLGDLNRGGRNSADEIRDVNRQIRGYWKKMADDGDSSLKDIRLSVTAYGKVIKRRLGDDTEEGKDALAKNFKAAARAVRESMRDGRISTETGLQYIRRYMAQALEQYGFSEQQAQNLTVHGVRETAAGTGNADGAGGGAARARGGWIRRAVGGWIGARGMVSDDVVPIAPGVIAAYGEYHATGSDGRAAVLNRHQTPFAEAALAAGGYGSLDSLPRGNALPILERALAPLGGLDSLFAAIQRPHYLAGGGRYNIVPVPGFPGESANASVIPMIEMIARRFGLVLTDAYGQGHKSLGHTQTGTAADFAGPDRAMDAAVKFLVARGYLVGYDGRFGSRAWSGHGPSSVAGSNAHLHVELASGRGGGALPTIRVRAPRVTGGGTVGRVVQAGLNVVAKGASRRANDLVSSSLAMPVAGGGGVAQGADANVVGAFRRAIRATGATPVERLALWEAGIVESGLRNLPYGDADSLGALQERASIYGRAHALNPYASAMRFLLDAQRLRPWRGSAGSLAQALQRSAYPGRYDQRAADARRYLAKGGRMHQRDQGDVHVGKTAPKRSAKVLEAMRRLWSAGSQFYPTRKAPGFPPVTFTGRNDNMFVAVDADNHSPTWGRMYWPPFMTNMFMDDKNSSAQSAAIQTIVHEWAHRFQDPAKIRRDWEGEGGAQNFARKYAARIARAAGFKWTSPDRGGRDDVYLSMANRVRRVHGADWFGFAGGGRVPRVTRSQRQKTTGGAQLSLPPAQHDRIDRYDELVKDVDGLNKGYSLWERRYNMEGGDQDLLNADGTVNEGRVKRQANYLRALMGIRSQIIDKLNEAQVVVQRIVASYQGLIDRLRESLKHAKGKDRSGIRKQIDGLRGKLGTWQGNLDELQNDLLPNAILDRQEIGKEFEAVLGTKADVQDASTDPTSSGGPESNPDVDAMLTQAQQRADSLAANLVSANNVIATFRGPGDIGTGGASAYASVWNDSQPVGSQWPGSRAATLAGGTPAGTIVNNYNMPGHPEVLRAIGDAATAGQSMQPAVQSSVERLGV